MSGSKYDADKVRMDLLDADALIGLADVLTFGAKKYAAHNWRGGIQNSRLVAALLRHLFAIQRGEYVDPESGLPHIDHVGCCWMFLSNNMKNRNDLNDLYQPTAPQMVRECTNPYGLASLPHINYGALPSPLEAMTNENL